jgi:hypothetical protein
MAVQVQELDVLHCAVQRFILFQSFLFASKSYTHSWILRCLETDLFLVLNFFSVLLTYLRIQCPSGAGTQDTSSKDKPATGTEHFYLAVTMPVMFFCFFSFTTYRKYQLRFHKIH